MRIVPSRRYYPLLLTKSCHSLPSRPKLQCKSIPFVANLDPSLCSDVDVGLFFSHGLHHFQRSSSTSLAPLTIQSFSWISAVGCQGFIDEGSTQLAAGGSYGVGVSGELAKNFDVFLSLSLSLPLLFWFLGPQFKSSLPFSIYLNHNIIN